MKLLESMSDFVKTNKRCKKYELITVEDSDTGEMIEIFATYVKSPSVLVADRLFIDAKYLWNTEFTAIMSS